MTKSLLLKPKVHFVHFIPNNLFDVGKKKNVCAMTKPLHQSTINTVQALIHFNLTV